MVSEMFKFRQIDRKTSCYFYVKIIKWPTYYKRTFLIVLNLYFENYPIIKDNPFLIFINNKNLMINVNFTTKTGTRLSIFKGSAAKNELKNGNNVEVDCCYITNFSYILCFLLIAKIKTFCRNVYYHF